MQDWFEQNKPTAGPGLNPRSNPDFFIHNPDGTTSSELSITIEDERINGGKPTNIPSIFKGKRVSDEEAIEIIARSGGIDPETGRKLEGFNSIDEAVRAAGERTNQLGQMKGADWFADNAPMTPEVTTKVTYGDPVEDASVGGFARNVGRSAGRFAKDTVGALAGMSYVQPDEESPTGFGVEVPPTLKAMGGLAAGVIQKALPGEQEQEKYADAFGQALTERYGGLEALKRTAYEDPVGFAADAATLMTGVGGVARGAAMGAVRGGRAASTLGKVADTASKAGRMMDPAMAVTRGAGAAVRGVANTIDPYKIYQSALKPVGKPEQAARAVRAGVDEGIPISMKGVAKNQALIDSINTEIDSIISNTKEVDTAAVVQTLDELKARTKNTVNPIDDLATIDAVKAEFLQFHGKKIPAKLAQEIKQNTYRKLKKSYGELKGANIEAQKAIARGLKDEIAKAFPELTELNKREGNLLALDDVFQKALKRIDNRDVLQLGTVIATTGGAAVAGPGGAALAAILRATIENPNFKSRLAIAIKNAQSRRSGSGRINRGVTAASRIEAYRDELEERMNSGIEADGNDDY